MDCWTSPNHRAFLAILAYFEKEGKPEVIVLDVVEVPESHTGERLAREANECLKGFGIDTKVSVLCILPVPLLTCTMCVADAWYHGRQRKQQ